MKKIYLLIVLCIIAGCGNQSTKNFNELKRLRIGMSFEKVNKIMSSEPVKIEDASWSKDFFVSSYQSPMFAADYYKVIFRKTDSIVVKINLAE